MKRYNITVNGTTYSVDVDEVDLAVIEDREALEEKIEVPVDIKPSRGNGKPMIPVINPLACQIGEIRVVEEQEVKDGELLAIVKVMDIENEIIAPADGEVTRILVTPGEKVEAGTCIIEMH